MPLEPHPCHLCGQPPTVENETFAWLVYCKPCNDEDSMVAGHDHPGQLGRDLAVQSWNAQVETWREEHEEGVGDAG